MKKKSIKTVASVIFVLLIGLISSCSSPTEKRIKEYVSNGKHIVDLAPNVDYGKVSYFYYYDEHGIFFANVETGVDVLLVEFHKEYIPSIISIVYDKDKDDLCIRTEESEYLDDVAEFSSNNRFSAYKDCALIIQDAEIPNRQYVFCIEKPDCCYMVHGAEGDVSQQHPFVDDCVRFTYEGDYWWCGCKGNEIGIPAHLKKTMDYATLRFWMRYDTELPMEIFLFKVDMEIKKDGTISIVSDYRFENIGKSYTSHQMSSGKASSDFVEIMDEKETEWLNNKIVNEGVLFDDMVSTFHTNPVKAKKTYVEGEQIILITELSEIKLWDSSRGKYRMKYMQSLSDELLVYSNEESFTELDYPHEVVIWATFKGVNESGWLITSYEYVFEDAILLKYK